MVENLKNGVIFMVECSSLPLLCPGGLGGVNTEGNIKSYSGVDLPERKKRKGN